MIIAHISDLLSNPTICESLVTTGAGRRHQFNLEWMFPSGLHRGHGRVNRRNYRCGYISGP